jgi:hypothetical protein
MKKINTLITLIATGAIGSTSPSIASESDNRQRVNLGTVMRYIEDNPHHQEAILNHTLEMHTDNEEEFSIQTQRNLANFVNEHYALSPRELKPELMTSAYTAIAAGYGDEIFANLSSDTKYQTVKSVTLTKSSAIASDACDITKDAFNKFKETKLYQKSRRVIGNFIDNLTRRDPNGSSN